MTVMINKHLSTIFFTVLSIFSCAKHEETNQINYGTLKLPKKPNIVWIVAEDLSPYIPTYGDSTVQTPNISRLAREGVTYTHFYSPSGVCAPSRAAIVTGMYPTRIGAHNMRTGPWFRFTIKDKALKEYAKYGRKAYEALPPAGTHMLSTYLKKDGYYCSNNPKEDYQFRCELTAWDESSFTAHWKNRKENQPFFAIFNIDVTHESMIWRKAKDSLFVDKDLDVPIPPYLPNTEIAKQDIRRNYSNIVEMDKRVGEILGELEQAGQLENTIVFWYSDHGGPLPREKRTIYNTGLQVPMIIRFPNKQLAGSTDSQMLSFIDLKPTVLSLVNIKPPDNLDGKAWMGKYAEHNKREYLFAAADRFDQQTDKIRAVFNKKFKLIRNYNTQQPYYLPVKYRETMPIMKELLRLRDKDSLTLEQQLWFRKTKDSIEFFDMENDPYEFHNLADKKEYQDKIGEMKSALDHWIKSTDDKGQLTEDDYIASIWPNGEQPKTAEPKLTIGNGEVSVSTETTGASIGYQWAKDESELTNSWDIYTGPIPIKPHNTLYVRAHRIGFKPSERVEQKF